MIKARLLVKYIGKREHVKIPSRRVLFVPRKGEKICYRDKDFIVDDVYYDWETPEDEVVLFLTEKEVGIWDD